MKWAWQESAPCHLFPVTLSPEAWLVAFKSGTVLIALVSLCLSLCLMSLSPSVVALSKVILTTLKRIRVMFSWLAGMQGAGCSDFESATVPVGTPISGDFGSDGFHFPTRVLWMGSPWLLF